MNNTDEIKLVFINGAYSFPFSDLGYPNITLFFKIVKELGFNARFIVMQREYERCFYSLCRRFCRRRKKALNAVNEIHLAMQHIENVLMALNDRESWIMLDYHDLVRNKLNYVDIISKWLNVEEVTVGKYFDHIHDS